MGILIETIMEEVSMEMVMEMVIVEISTAMVTENLMEMEMEEMGESVNKKKYFFFRYLYKVSLKEKNN